MVRAWYIEGDALEHPKDENQRLPPKFITLEELYKLTGVEHHALNVDTYETDGSLQKLKEEKCLDYENDIETPETDTLQEFYKEHLHDNEEMRFVLDGCGYYDVRDKADEWIRIEVATGDLISIPGGCYHRFMLDHTAKRISKDCEYQVFDRPADDRKCRHLQHLQKMKC